MTTTEEFGPTREVVPFAWEVRMSDSAENTGLDGAVFASREDAQAAADVVNAEFPRARAEVCRIAADPTTTFAEWHTQPW